MYLRKMEQKEQQSSEENLIVLSSHSYTNPMGHTQWEQ